MATSSNDRRNVYEPMWRPVKTAGLPRDYFYILAVVTPLVWFISQRLTPAILVFLSLYAFGYFKSEKDPEFMLVHLVRVFKIKRKVRKYKGKRGSMYIV